MCIELGEHWRSAGRQDADKQGQLEKCKQFLVKSANDSGGAFRSAEFRKRDSAWAWTAAPWRGWFPRQPLYSTAEIEVLDLRMEVGNPSESRQQPSQPLQHGADSAGPEPGAWRGEKLEIGGSDPSPQRLGQSSASLLFASDAEPMPAPSAPPLQDITGVYLESIAAEQGEIGEV